MRRLAAVIAAVATVAAATAGPAPQPARASDAAYVHTPRPAVGAVVSSGTVQISAHLRSDVAVEGGRVLLDGAEVAATTTQGAGTALVATSVDAAPGDHRVRVEFHTETGEVVARVWRFHATDHTVRRLGGVDRVATSTQISAVTYPGSATAQAAVLARADEFADALSGAPLAAAVDGPLLLTPATGLAADVAAELRRVLPAGAVVHLLGGTAALSEQVEDDVAALGFVPDRIAGVDRFETAEHVAARLPSLTGAFVVSGGSFPDALAASVPAARDGHAILLTPPARLAESTHRFLQAANLRQITIVGGTTVVGDGVRQQLDGLAPSVHRVAGPDRFATAVAVAAAFLPDANAASLASGVAFPDALTGTRHAAATGQPILLAADRVLPHATRDEIARRRVRNLDVYGGAAAVGNDVMDAAWLASVDGAQAPRLVASTPHSGAAVADVELVQLTFDRPVDPADSTVHVEIDGREVRGRLETSSTSRTLLFRPFAGEVAREYDVAHDARIHVAARDGRRPGHGVISFVHLEPDPVYATVGPVELRLPSRAVQLIGFHQSNHDGAQQQVARDTATPKVTMRSRARDTGGHGAADIVAAPDREIVAPVTGRVLRAGSYVLYCRYTDDYAVIEPDARPGWEVKLLHFQGLQVATGDRVVAGETVIGTGPRTLPFRSQVDDYSDSRDWPHVHLEVVDPSIPDRPSGGC